MARHLPYKETVVGSIPTGATNYHELTMRMKHIDPVDADGIQDDWIRELTDEDMRRFHRVSGECICEVCGNEYYDHPVETRILGNENEPFLYRLCNGWFGKL